MVVFRVLAALNVSAVTVVELNCGRVVDRRFLESMSGQTHHNVPVGLCCRLNFDFYRSLLYFINIENSTVYI